MSNVAVSVIVPIYNVEKYLSECLDSLVRQTFKDIEVIMVNDGSTDHSRDIAQKYAEKYSNFKLINRENGGQSAARNTGMAHASGEYIYFIDSDDYLVDNAIETLYCRATKDDLDVLIFVGYNFTDANKELTWSHDNGYYYRGNYPSVMNGLESLQAFIDNHDELYPSCCMIFTRLKTIKENNLSFYEGIIHEDNLFHFELLSLSERVAVLNQPLYCRRIREGSITQTRDWHKKAFSFGCITISADEFINAHPEISGSTAGWFVFSFLSVYIYNWSQMNRQEQYSQESRKFRKQLKPIFKNYKKGRCVTFWLFFTCIPLYKARMMISNLWVRIPYRKINSCDYHKEI